MPEPSELETWGESLDPRAKAFLAEPIDLIIGGARRPAMDGGTFATFDPANGRQLAVVPRAGSEDVEAAINLARDSFDGGAWRSAPPKERAAVLSRVADLLEEHATPLAQLETLDNGMPFTDALAAPPRGAEHFRYFAGWPTKIHGETIPVSTPGKIMTYTKREPVGVVAAIIAWNTPIDNAVWKLAAPLAAGCSVILKPAEQTPLTALYIGGLLREAGLPQGVVSVLSGFGDTGAKLANHELVDKVAFTGSTEIGREIVRASAGNLKRVSLELGGKSPAIVFADADLAVAAPGVFKGLFWNAGQICCASSRVLVERSIHDQFLDAVVSEAERLRVGPGFSAGSEMGPVISDEQLDRVTEYVASGIDQGAHLATGGARLGGELEAGHFLAPTVLADVQPDTRVFQEEIFGPVLAVTDFVDERSLRNLANETIYGLAASVWTRSLQHAFATIDVLQAGTVWVNMHTTLDPATPFGGFKQSGYGRELGRAALENYLDTKCVWVNYE